MRIPEQEMERLLASCCLDGHSEDKEAHLRSLEAILEHIDVLKTADTDAVEPTLHVSMCSNVLREDEALESMGKNRALSNAPTKEQGTFTVPRIV